MKILLNLATRTYIHRRALYASYSVIAALLVLMLGINFSLMHSTRQKIAEYQANLNETRKQFGGLSEGAEKSFSSADYRELLADIHFANSILAKDGFRWTALLNHLEELLPKGASIRSLKPDYKDRSLSVTAVARGIDEMQEFLDQLMYSEWLSDAYLISQEKVEVTDFAGRKREAIRFVTEIQEAF